MKTLVLVFLTISMPAVANEYRVKNAYISKQLTLKQAQFDLNTVNHSGNLCQLEGSIQQGLWHDGEGCEVRFQFTGNRVHISIPDAATDACRQYCGLNADFVGEYHALPTACQQQAVAQMEQQFKTAYQQKRYPQAAQIKQRYLNQCQDFLHIVDEMRTRNDLAISYKNTGNLAACRRVLQPIAHHIQPASHPFEPSMLYKEAYQREVKHARFNQRVCQ